MKSARLLCLRLLSYLTQRKLIISDAEQLRLGETFV